MITHELVRTVGMDDGSSGYRVVFYSQPSWRWMAAHLYHRWHRLTDTAIAPIEYMLNRRHRVLCDDDCSSGTTPSGQAVKLCGYMPLSVRRDCRCYELHGARRTELTEMTLTTEQARLLGWKSAMP